MSIATELTKLTNTKASLRTAISAQGVGVSGSAKLADYPALIGNIARGVRTEQSTIGLSIGSNNDGECIRGLCVHNSTLIGVTDRGYIFYSDNNQSFTSAYNSLFSTSRPMSIYSFCGKVYIPIVDGDVISSATGKGAWTVASQDYLLKNSYGVITHKGLGISFGQDGKINTSPDGKAWTQRNSNFPFMASIFSAISFRDIVVAVGENGAIITSPDGITWTQRTSGTTNHLHSIVEFRGKLYAAGSIGRIISSSDGITWANVPNTFGSSDIWKIHTHYGIIIAVGNDGKLMISQDGIEWLIKSSGFYSSSQLVTAVSSGDYVFFGGLETYVRRIFMQYRWLD